MNKYKLMLNGDIIQIDQDGNKIILEKDKFEIMTLENGDKFIQIDGKNFQLEKETLVEVKDNKDILPAIREMQEMVVHVTRTHDELKQMNTHLQELVKSQKEQGANFQYAQRQGEYAVDGDYIFGNTKNANDILSMPIDGVKMYLDGKGSVIEIPPENIKSRIAWEFQKRSDNLLTLSKVTGKPVRSLSHYKSFLDWIQASQLRKAIDTATSGEGSEWIPTGYSARLYEKVRLNLMVAGLHDTIPMPTSPFVPPVQTSDATAYYVPENISDDGTKITASTPGSNNFTLTARKIAARVVASSEATEDSVFPLIPFIERNIAQAVANGVENCIINGDTSTSHQDSDVTASNDVRKAWLGYRKLASNKSATVDFSNATPTASLFATIRSTMGSPYAISPNRLAWVVSGLTYLLLLNDTTSLQTVDKYGQFATLLTGELGRLYNIPVIVSEYQRENLNASGVYDGSTTNRTVAQLVFRPGFVVGMRTLGISVDRVKDVERDQWKIVAIHRTDFQSIYGNSDKTVANAYNIKES